MNSSGNARLSLLTAAINRAPYAQRRITMFNTVDMTEVQSQQYLDKLRKEHPINGALQTLATFIMHTNENAGAISPQNALYLAAAAKNTVDLLLAECRALDI